MLVIGAVKEIINKGSSEDDFYSVRNNISALNKGIARTAGAIRSNVFSIDMDFLTENADFHGKAAVNVMILVCIQNE